MKNRNPAGMWHLYKTGGLASAVTSVFNPRSAQHMAFIRSMTKEQRVKSLFDLSLGGMELVVFDLETTGFSPYNGDEIISIGAVSVIGEIIDEHQTFYCLVNPKRIIPDEIVSLTGITNEMAGGAPDLIVGLRGFLEFVQRKVLVAHGAGHDKHFLSSALWKTSKAGMSHRILDTMMVARWLNPKLNSYDLDTILDFYEIETTTRHHALEDALMTARLWNRLKLDIHERKIQTLGDLYVQLSR